MMNETLASGPVIAIIGMALATALVRMSGYWLMGRVPMTPRVRRGLEILPGAIMAATVIPIAVKGGIVAIITVIVAYLVMFRTRNEFIAAGFGLATAALLRWSGL